MPMYNVNTEYKKFVMHKKTKLIFLCHIKMKFYFFLTHDYIFVAMWQWRYIIMTQNFKRCPKHKFDVTRKVILCWNKKFDVAQKIIWCRQKRVDVARKSVSCQQKKSWCCTKRYFLSTKTRWSCIKKIFCAQKSYYFFLEWRTILLIYVNKL